MNWKGDRETDTLIRGAKCAAMKEVLKEIKEKSQVVPQAEKKAGER